jgi:hypothetical protein
VFFYPTQKTNNKFPELTELQIKVIRDICKGTILKNAQKVSICPTSHLQVIF